MLMVFGSMRPASDYGFFCDREKKVQSYRYQVWDRSRLDSTDGKSNLIRFMLGGESLQNNLRQELRGIQLSCRELGL